MSYFKTIRLIVLLVILLGVIGVTVFGYYPDLFMPGAPEQKYGFKDQGLWGKSPAEIKDLCLKSEDMEYVTGCLDAIGRHKLHSGNPSTTTVQEVIAIYREIYEKSATQWEGKEAPAKIDYAGFMNAYTQVESKSFSDHVRAMILRQLFNIVSGTTAEDIRAAMDVLESVKPGDGEPLLEYWNTIKSWIEEIMRDAGGGGRVRTGGG